MSESSGFPVSQAGDSEQVQLALETAGALWSKGDAREAVRWLRRAAETAGDAGDDLRAVSLARAAADLTSDLQIPPSMTPSNPRASHDPPVQAAPPQAAPAQATPPQAAPPQAAPVHGPTRPRQALRVAVTPSDNDKALLLVRVLAEGEPASQGAHEAFLVALDAGANLVARKR